MIIRPVISFEKSFSNLIPTTNDGGRERGAAGLTRGGAGTVGLVNTAEKLSAYQRRGSITLSLESS